MRNHRDGGPSEEAVSLFARLDADEATSRDLKRLLDWSEQSPEKLEELEALTRFWQELGRMPCELADEESGDFASLFSPPAGPHRWLRHVSAAGGALAAALLIGAVLAFEDVRLIFLPEDVYATEQGEVKQFVLDDESLLHLNGRSRVTVKFDERIRRVELEHGEAFFEVAHDATRAFVVDVGDFEVRALGTAFNIDFALGQVDLAVLDGTVELAAVNADPGKGVLTPMRVDPGERVTIEEHKEETADKVGVALQHRKIANVETIISWRRGVINLAGETLARAAEKINRQSEFQLAIGDHRIADYPIYGSFEADNLASFISAVEILYPVRSVRGENGYVLYAAEEEPDGSPS